jgi:drug/metabolite transporter (DMT)-like permease
MPSLLRRRPEIVLVGVTFLWSSTFIATKDILRYAPPIAYLTARFGTAAIVLLLLYPGALHAKRRTFYDASIIGLAQTVGIGLQVFGQLYTTASKSAFVTSFSTALTPMLALALHGERPTRPQAAGVLLASAGLYLLTYPTGAADWNRGDLITSGCAVVYAFIIVQTARYTRRSDVRHLAALQTSFAALGFVLLLAAAHLAGRFWPAPLPEVLRLELRPFSMSWKLFAYLSYMSLVCTVLTFLGQFWAMARMSATHAAVVFALEPVFATALAIAVEGGSEWPGSRGAAGAALVLAGVLASEMKRFGTKRIA